MSILGNKKPVRLSVALFGGKNRTGPDLKTLVLPQPRFLSLDLQRCLLLKTHSCLPSSPRGPECPSRLRPHDEDAVFPSEWDTPSI